MDVVNRSINPEREKQKKREKEKKKGRRKTNRRLRNMHEAFLFACFSRFFFFLFFRTSLFGLFDTHRFSFRDDAKDNIFLSLNFCVWAAVTVTTSHGRFKNNSWPEIAEEMRYSIYFLHCFFYECCWWGGFPCAIPQQKKQSDHAIEPRTFLFIVECEMRLKVLEAGSRLLEHVCVLRDQINTC